MREIYFDVRIISTNKRRRYRGQTFVNRTCSTVVTTIKNAQASILYSLFHGHLPHPLFPLSTSSA